MGKIFPMRPLKRAEERRLHEAPVEPAPVVAKPVEPAKAPKTYDLARAEARKAQKAEAERSFMQRRAIERLYVCRVVAARGRTLLGSIRDDLIEAAWVAVKGHFDRLGNPADETLCLGCDKPADQITLRGIVFGTPRDQDRDERGKQLPFLVASLCGACAGRPLPMHLVKLGQLVEARDQIGRWLTAVRANEVVMAANCLEAIEKTLGKEGTQWDRNCATDAGGDGLPFFNSLGSTAVFSASAMAPARAAGARIATVSRTTMATAVGIATDAGQTGAVPVLVLGSASSWRSGG